MEPIDVAMSRLDALLAQLPDYAETIHTEQDTRLKVINPVFVDVLDWPLREILTEEHAVGSGFVDYKLTTGGFARLVVEAKRDGRDLGLAGRTAGRAYKLDGAVFNTDSVKEGIQQGIRYCGQKNAELACVTNGREWVVFRGSRIGDGRDTMEGMAFVFPTLEDVRERFALFYDLLSYAGVAEFRFRAYFQEAEGRPIRAHAFRRSLRLPANRRHLPQSALTADLDRVMTSFFRRLSGDDDPDLLAHCFVVTRESQIADARLARISEDLLGRIRDLETEHAEQLTALVERVRRTRRNEFILLIGTKGAGKSTFIDRFFRHVLSEDLRNECLVARLNLADSAGDEASIATWLDRHLLETLEAALFAEGVPTYDELQGMFYDEYQRWRVGAFSHLYERDKEAFKIEFGRHVERRREERPHEYIQRLVGHIVRVRRRVPCLVFDNADHFTIEFQERVFQYARSIYEAALCLVIMPITDRTSWQLSREGALRSFENESLFLPTPRPEAVLRKRVEFLEARLADERREAGRGYFLGRGIPLSIDNLTAFTAALQAVFLRSGQVSEWIGNLANNDIRRCLELAKNVITSPYLAVPELIAAYVTATNIHMPQTKVRNALMRAQYDIWPGEANPFVRNIYAMDDEIDASPLFGLRMLLLLKDARQADNGDPFVAVDQVVEYCRAMQVDTRVTLAWLGRMLEAGLCLSYDPTVTTIHQASTARRESLGG